MNHSFFTTDYTTERLVQSGNKSSYSASISGKGHFTQASDEATAINQLQLGDLYLLYVEASKDIIVTDRVTIGGFTYSIKGVKNSVLGSLSVKKLQLVKSVG